MRANRAGAPLGAAPRAGGFTLLEILVVLAVLGLALGILALRGPSRVAALELRSAAGELAQGLRLARARAIASNRPVALALDVGRRRWWIEGRPERPLPANLVVSLRLAGPGAAAGRGGVIRFAPDGSSTGGWLELSDGRRRMQLGVDGWSGRVTLSEAPGLEHPGGADAR
ncbi:GspH/FimT family pseudopilin [Roseicella sp. DB1501]|uniref:GspH/FimT family pseudopilin n=1 Tax=Roseicella sp. DB1501 TaxID=2730925 RepID=UPI00149168F3|nr:GspH/FimT family pseudopilin [Roseicella sp. DB1501]NOG73828.1 prepilin-type N-terminal cleavage/methylation domain-containing protein [Roseicella sp. DB1501]